jgi:hypothetical protein
VISLNYLLSLLDPYRHSHFLWLLPTNMISYLEFALKEAPVLLLNWGGCGVLEDPEVRVERYLRHFRLKKFYPKSEQYLALFQSHKHLAEGYSILNLLLDLRTHLNETPFELYDVPLVILKKLLLLQVHIHVIWDL